MILITKLRKHAQALTVGVLARVQLPQAIKMNVQAVVPRVSKILCK